MLSGDFYYLLYMYCGGNITFMLAIRLKPELEQRLASLAERTGRTKTFYAREAIESHLEDLEDAYIAIQRLEQPERIYTSEEVERELGL